MRKKKKKAEGPKGSPAYMTTYGDMMTLLLCFFVLIVSFSTMEIEKFKAAVASLKGALSVLPYQTEVMPTETMLERPSRGEKRDRKSRRRSRSVTSLRKIIREKHLENIIQVKETESGVHVTIGDPALFDSGKADIKPEILPVLNQIVAVVDSGDEIIRVEGHTDNVPIHTAEFANNWDLSIARAMSVIRYIQSKQENLDPTRLRPIGGGEFHPKASNDTPEGRAMNRRVEIFIEFGE